MQTERSAGRTVEFAGESFAIEPLTPRAFEGVEIVLSSTPASVSVPVGDRLVIELHNTDPSDVHDLVLANGVSSGRATTRGPSRCRPA